MNRNLAPSADPEAGDSWSTRLGLQPWGGGQAQEAADPSKEQLPSLNRSFLLVLQ